MSWVLVLLAGEVVYALGGGLVLAWILRVMWREKRRVGAEALLADLAEAGFPTWWRTWSALFWAGVFWPGFLVFVWRDRRARREGERA